MKSDMPKNETKTIRRRVAITFTEPSQAVQEYRDSTDINNIIRRFKLTGELPPRIRKQPLYADVSNIPDYATALNQVNEAQEAFFELPAELRARFNNDPGKMLAWVENPKNREAAETLGLLAPSPKPKAKSVSPSETAIGKPDNPNRIADGGSQPSDSPAK